jgi:microcystin-dependent protein
MADPFVAEIRMFAGNFAPTGWAFCSGQLMPISQNTALFSLLGTFYGGDGKTTFALPNLEGASPMHHGLGPGLSDRVLGEAAGTDFVTLIESEMPIHNHSAKGGVALANSNTPVNNAWGGAPQLPYTNSSNATMNPLAISMAGGSLPHNNLMPYLVVSFIIALQGVFPPRG